MAPRSSDKRDIYYRLAKSNGWRARSAYKLLQIDKHFNVFKDVTRAVDLCAAPGSWSQVLSAEIYARHAASHAEPSEDAADADPTIVAVDLQPMAPLPGVHQILGDITSEQTATAIIDKFHGHKADLVVCDGAPDVTGLHAFDEFLQSQLVFANLMTRAKTACYLAFGQNCRVFAAFNISSFVLRVGGTFVSKVFLASDGMLLKVQMSAFFETVTFFKPQSSRASSSESFIVCVNYRPPAGYVPNLTNPMNAPDYEIAKTQFHGINRELVPFMCCGDLSGFDSERTHSLENDKFSEDLRQLFGLKDEWTSHGPVAPPTEPAYKHAVHLKKNSALAQPAGEEVSLAKLTLAESNK